MSDVLDLAEFFCCPYCQGDLRPSKNALRCMRCGAQFALDDGIPCLVPQGVRTDYALTSHQDRLNRRAMEIGWKDAVLEHTKTERHQSLPDAEYANEYICSEARADFRFLMPVDGNSVVLDIRSGWGNITTAFARTSRQVIGLDINLDNLRFVQLRARQERLHNVIVAQGDACALPVRPASCDAAVMVGALEWVAWGRAGGSPHRLQEQALRKVHRALKPGGCLYVAMENRFSFEYFLGAEDPHTGLRFVSLLPHLLAQKYSKLVRGREYLEITYSLWGLRKLLHSVGFGQVDFFFPIPGYQSFRFLVAFEDRGVLRFLLEQLRTHPRFTHLHHLAGRVVLSLPLGVGRFFWPCFSVLAIRS